MVRSRETDRGVISVVEAEQGHDQRPEDAKQKEELVQQESTWQACLPEVRARYTTVSQRDYVTQNRAVPLFAGCCCAHCRAYRARGRTYDVYAREQAPGQGVLRRPAKSSWWPRGIPGGWHVARPPTESGRRRVPRPGRASTCACPAPPPRSAARRHARASRRPSHAASSAAVRYDRST